MRPRRAVRRSGAAVRGLRGERSLRLDPVRWPPLRTAVLVRAAVVAGLLSLAAGLVYARSPNPACPGPAPSAARSAAASAAGRPGVTAPAGRPGAASPRGPADPTTGVGPPAGTVGVAVTLADPAPLEVLTAGDRVDLIVAAPGERDGASTLAQDALVLATPGDGPGGGLYLALPAGPARAVVTLPPDARLAVVVRP